MEAKVTKAFPGRPDSEVMTRAIEVGEIISGDLAAVAVREKWATEIKASSPNKRGKGNELREDGPTVAEYVAAGYLASNYPPEGYASRSTPEEIAAAVAVEKKPD